MFHRIAIWRVFAMLDFSTFQRNPPKPAIPRVSEPRFGFEVACISVQCDVELRQRADPNAQAPTPLKALAAVFRADSNPLSLVREGPSRRWSFPGLVPKSEKFSKNFRFIDARVTVRPWCSCINECYSRKSARPRTRQYECRARANAVELTRGHPGKRGNGSCRSKSATPAFISTSSSPAPMRSRRYRRRSRRLSEWRAGEIGRA